MAYNQDDMYGMDYTPPWMEEQAAPAADQFTDYDWDSFLKQEKNTSLTPGNWPAASPTPGSDVANEGWFNAGTPGSLTALINAQNPTADPGKAYVNAGNTGGYQEGVGVTIGPGRSTRPADYVDMYNKAVEKFGLDRVRDFESRNAFDINRVNEALEGEDRQGGGGGGSSSGGGGGSISAPSAPAPAASSAPPGDWVSASLEKSSSGSNDMIERMQQEIMGLIDSGGAYNPEITRRRRESAREAIDSGRKAQTNQARAALADRGLLSLPGVASGAEAGTLQNIEELLAPIYAGTLRDIETDEMGNADSRFLAALGLGTGSGQSEFENSLAAAMGGNARQKTLADIALGTLDRSLSWQSVLAQLGMAQDSDNDNDLISALLNS